MDEKQIGILIFEDMEELDAIGPWEVLAYWTRMWPDDGWQVFTLAREAGPVRCAKGLVIIPDHSYETAPQMDVLIYPGGQGTRRQLRDEDQLEWLRKRASDVPLVASVCTGSLVLAAAGLLHRRPATTYWGALDLLRELDPSIDVRDAERFVDSGEVITAAGVSAGIDMALHLVARLQSVERAKEVRRGIQYDPEPPV
jgi:transcriptional regulator GlxA family with amidase domain